MAENPSAPALRVGVGFVSSSLFSSLHVTEAVAAASWRWAAQRVRAEPRRMNRNRKGKYCPLVFRVSKYLGVRVGLCR